MMVTIVVGVVTLLLPYSPLANTLGFKPLAPSTLSLIAVIVVLYFMSAELVKRWFYRRYFR